MLGGRKKPQNSGRLKCARDIQERKIKKRAEVSESLLAIKVGTNIHFFQPKKYCVLTVPGAGETAANKTHKNPALFDILAINVSTTII